MEYGIGKMRTLVIGDIHGRYTALKEVLKKANFNFKEDKLIVLGDVVDGGWNTQQVVDTLLLVKDLVLVLGNHDCLDNKTELLTKRGWLNYNDIKNNDEIYSFDTTNEKGVWSKINAVIVKKYKGKMINLKSKNCDMCITPTHRFFYKVDRVKPSYFGNKKYRYCLAENIRGSYLVLCSASDKNLEYNIKDNMIKLIGWILTDGSVNKRGIKYIFQSKPNNIVKIRQLLNSLNLEYSERKDDGKRNIVINGKQVKNQLPSTTFYIKSSSSKQIPLNDKNIPNWVYKLSDRQFKLFLESVIGGDGTHYASKRGAVIYEKKEFLEQLQILCITKGYRANLVYIAGQPRLNITFKNTWGFCSSDKIKKNELYEEDYNNNVWCLNVKHSNFMVRRNGTHYFTGNCWFMDHIKNGWSEQIWLGQGGANTLVSYGGRVLKEGGMYNDDVIVDGTKIKIPVEHQKLFNKGVFYYIYKNMLFVHGGFDVKVGIEKTDRHDLVWDRELIKYAQKQPVPQYNKVFIGHTTTQLINNDTNPIKFNNLWMLDCGAGWNGKLCIMDVDTEKYWLSEKQNKPI